MIARETLEAMGFPWPGDHPGNGSPLVAFDLKQDTQVMQVRTMPPQRPERDYVTEWDDDGPVAWHTRTDEELAEALAAYEKTSAEWGRTGGMLRSVAGPPLVSCSFVAEDGGKACAAYDGQKWIWVEWSTP